MRSRNKVVPSEREDGFELWLRYRKASNPDRLAQHRQVIHRTAVFGKNSAAEIIRGELERALPALLDASTHFVEDNLSGNAPIAGTVRDLGAAGIDVPQVQCNALGNEVF
jgi:alpha-glucuronidase